MTFANYKKDYIRYIGTSYQTVIRNNQFPRKVEIHINTSMR